jgi:predicted phage terminase large subunit-like protein
MRIVQYRITMHGRQQEFVASPFPKLFVGGIGAGKTRAGIFQLLTMPPHTTGVIIAPTYTMLNDVIRQSIYEVAEPLLVKDDRANHIVELSGKRTVLLRSATRPDRLRGLNLDWVWIDEACYVPEDVYLIAIGRLRQHPSRYWLTTTPVKASWVYERFVAGGEPISITHAPTLCNPYLHPSYVETLRARYGTLLAQRELGAEWVELGGHYFQQGWVRYDDTLRTRPATVVAVGVDLAVGLDDHADYTAAVVVRYDPQYQRYLVEDAVAGRWTFNEQLARVHELATRYEAHVVVVESNQYQQVFAQQLASQYRHYVRPYHARTRKEQRILSLAPLYEMGHITHARRLTELEAQLLAYPHTQHDDLLDALVYAIEGTRLGHTLQASQVKLAPREL